MIDFVWIMSITTVNPVLNCFFTVTEIFHRFQLLITSNQFQRIFCENKRSYITLDILKGWIRTNLTKICVVYDSWTKKHIYSTIKKWSTRLWASGRAPPLNHKQINLTVSAVRVCSRRWCKSERYHEREKDVPDKDELRQW